MLQQLMTAPGIIDFRKVSRPRPGPGQVVIKVMRIGICGSDIHVYHGTHPFTHYPVTQGHEVSGEISEVGKDITNFHIGQSVTIQPQVVCGKCYLCRHGKYNLCEDLKVMGFQTTGAASEYFAIDANWVTPLLDGMTPDEGAMIEPLAVAVHAIRKGGGAQDKKIVVLGAGTIGNLVAQAAKGMGAADVMITDISDWRLEKAKECGISILINSAKKDLEDEILAFFGPDKADLIVDCAGNNVTMGQAIQCARKGTKIILVAVFEDLACIDLAVTGDRELEIKGSLMYREEDYEEAIRLVNEGRVKLASLISKHFDFLDFKKAYEFIEEHGEMAMKVIVDVQN